MSNKSIGFSAFSIPDGDYTQAKMVVNQNNQVIGLTSQTITSTGDDLIEEYEGILTSVKNLQTVEKVIQQSLNPANGLIIPLVASNTQLIVETTNLNAQNEISLQNYIQATSRFIPTLVLEKTATELNIVQIKTDSSTETNTLTIQSVELQTGRYQLYVNLLGLSIIGGSLVPQLDPINPMNELAGQSNLELQVFSGTTLLSNIISNDFSYQNDNMQCSICGSCSFFIDSTKTIDIKLNFFNLTVGVSGTSGGSLFLQILTTNSNTFGLQIQAGGQALALWKIAA